MLCVIEYFAKSLNVTETGTIRKLGYGFLFAFYNDCCHFISEIKRDIGRKSRFFS